MADPVIAEAIGVIDGSNVDFDTASAYISGTVRTFWNGKLVASDEAQFGYTELGGTSVRMASAPVVGDRLYFWYHTSPPTGGAFKEPPAMLSALNLTLTMRQAINLRPKMISAEEQ